MNDRPLFGRRTGVGRYVEQLLANWPSEGAVRVRGVCSKLTKPKRSNINDVSLDDVSPLNLIPLSEAQPSATSSTPSRSRMLLRSGFRLGMQLGMRMQGRRADVYFEPNHIPVGAQQPQVTAIHDLSVIEHPECHPADRVRDWQKRFVEALNWSDRFVCVSHATASALQQLFDVESNRIEVIHLAPTWDGAPASWSAESCRQRLDLPDDCILHFGTIEPRKNLRVLLDALQIHRERGGTANLVFLGGFGWGERTFWDGLLTHPMASEIQWAGFVSNAQALAALIACRGVVCPSIHEGFGLPPLEAMRLGTRAVVSTAAALVEVVGDAARSIDPSDHDSWAEALASLLDHDAESEMKAQERACEFSWTRAARLHADLFRRSAES